MLLREYKKLIESQPPAHCKKYYRNEVLKHVNPKGRDLTRLIHFYLLIAIFITLQWLIVKSDNLYIISVSSIGLSLILISFFAFLHEFMHYAITKNIILTWVHAWVAGLYSGITPNSWQSEHNCHHAHLGVPIQDPDAVYDQETYQHHVGIRRGLYFIPGVVHILGTWIRPIWWMAAHGNLLFNRFLSMEHISIKKKVIGVTTFVINILFQIVMTYMFGWKYFLFGFFLPVCVSNIGLTYFLLGTHLACPTSPEKDPLLGSISIRLPRILQWIFCDAQFHTEHHLFPNLSHRKLRKVNEVLKSVFPNQFKEISAIQSVKSLEQSGRIYYQHNILWNPIKNKYYTTLLNVNGEIKLPEELIIDDEDFECLEVLH